MKKPYCPDGHENFSEGEHLPTSCAWPRCAAGASDTYVRVEWVEHGPQEPIAWGTRPTTFQRDVEKTIIWKREEGWRPNGKSVWRWVPA